MAIGWIWAVEWFVGERRAWITVPLASAAGLVAGAFIAWRLRVEPAALVALAGGLTGFVVGWLPSLGPRVAQDGWSYSRPVTIATVLVLSFAVASAALGVNTLRARPAASGPARAAAITTVDQWVRDNIPAGSRLAFGSFLGWGMALTLERCLRRVTCTPRQRVVVRHGTRRDQADRRGPRRTIGCRSTLRRATSTNSRRSAAAGWCATSYKMGPTTGSTTSATGTSARAGARRGDARTWPRAGRPLRVPDRLNRGTGFETYIFKVDPTKVAFDPNVLYVSPRGLTGCSTCSSGTLPRRRTSPRDWSRRWVIFPASPDDGALMDRLRRLAQRDERQIVSQHGCGTKRAS